MSYLLSNKPMLRRGICCRLQFSAAVPSISLSEILLPRQARCNSLSSSDWNEETQILVGDWLSRVLSVPNPHRHPGVHWLPLHSLGAESGFPFVKAVTHLALMLLCPVWVEIWLLREARPAEPPPRNQTHIWQRSPASISHREGHIM